MTGAPSAQRPAKRLVVLDIDGVILDSRINMQHAWRAVSSALGVAVPFDAYFAQIGRPFVDIMSLLGLSHIARQCETIYRQASAATLHETPFFRGIPETLQRLVEDDVKLAILTSKDRERALQVVERLPVVFTAIQTPDPRYPGKPHPDQLVRTASLSRETLEDTCYVGDMPVDAETAHRAGVDYLHARWGYGDLSREPRLVLDEPADLLTVARGSHAFQ